VRTADAHVVDREQPAPGLVTLWLSAPEISHGARPGQFMMLQPSATLDPFLARPFWIHRVRDRDGRQELAVLVDVIGRAGRLLAAMTPGQSLRITGPLGRAIAIARTSSHLLLIGEGYGIAPLIWLADEEIRRGTAVTLVLATASPIRLFPSELVAPEVEIAAFIGAEAVDGAYLATVCAEYGGWSDAIVASGTAALPAMLGQVLRQRDLRRPCHVLLAPPMPCGTGICGACTVRLRRSRARLVCRDGPVFDLRDI